MISCLCILTFATLALEDGSRSQHFLLPDEQGEPLAVVTHKRTVDRGLQVLEHALVWRDGALVLLDTESVGPEGFKLVHRELPRDGRGGRTWLAEVRATENVLRFETHCWGAPSPRSMSFKNRPIGVGGLTEILAAGARPLQEVQVLDPTSGGLLGVWLHVFDAARDPLVLSAAGGAIRAAGLSEEAALLTGYEWRTLDGRVLHRQVFCGGELILFQPEGRQAWARRVRPRQAAQFKRRWVSSRGTGKAARGEQPVPSPQPAQ